MCQTNFELKFEIPATEFQDQKSKTIHPFSGEFDFNNDQIDAAFRHLSDRAATVTDTNRGLKLTLEYADIYSTLVF